MKYNLFHSLFSTVLLRPSILMANLETIVLSDLENYWSDLNLFTLFIVFTLLVISNTRAQVLASFLTNCHRTNEETRPVSAPCNQLASL